MEWLSPALKNRVNNIREAEYELQRSTEARGTAVVSICRGASRGPVRYDRAKQARESRAVVAVQQEIE
jgi:hypothetical protein